MRGLLAVLIGFGVLVAIRRMRPAPRRTNHIPGTAGTTPEEEAVLERVEMEDFLPEYEYEGWSD